MARSTMAKSVEMQSQLVSIKAFIPEPGKAYRLLFLADEAGEIMYNGFIHDVKGADGKSQKRGCLKDFYPDDFYLADEHGNQTNEINPKYFDRRTKEPMYNGKCPYCELNSIKSKQLSAEVDAYKKEHGPEGKNDRTKDEIDSFVKDTLQKNQVSRRSVGREFVAAVIKTTDNLATKFDLSDAEIPKFDLVHVSLTPNQYDTKFVTALSQLGGKVNNTELIFSYPAKAKFSESIKDMTMQPAINKSLDTYKDLMEAIQKKLSTIDLDTLDSKMRKFVRQPYQAVLSEIAPIYKEVTQDIDMDTLTDEQKKLNDDMVRVSPATLSELSDSFETKSADETQKQIEDSAAATDTTGATDDTKSIDGVVL